jgi:ferrous iron transport protein A
MGIERMNELYFLMVLVRYKVRIMTLMQATTGQTVRIKRIEGGVGFEHKLRQLGLFPGDSARVLRHAPLGGPILVEIEGRSIALGRGVASRVIVEAS